MIGENVKRILRQSGTTQTAAAKLLGVSVACINQWISEKRDISNKDLAKFCKVFKTTPNAVFGFEDDITEQDKALLAAVKSLTAPKETANNSSDPAKQAQIPAGKEQER